MQVHQVIRNRWFKADGPILCCNCGCWHIWEGKMVKGQLYLRTIDKPKRRKK